MIAVYQNKIVVRIWHCHQVNEEYEMKWGVHMAMLLSEKFLSTITKGIVNFFQSQGV